MFEAAFQHREKLILIFAIGSMLLAQLFLHNHAISHLADHHDGDRGVEYCDLCFSSPSLENSHATSISVENAVGVTLLSGSSSFHLVYLFPRSNNLVRAPPVV